MISANFEKLFIEAKKVRDNAHVPYSQFKVGAALLSEDNSIVVGCNVDARVAVPSAYWCRR